MYRVQGKWGLALVTSTRGTLLLMLLLLPIFRQLGCVNRASIHCVFTLACARTRGHTNQNRSLNISLIGGRRQQSTYTYPSQSRQSDNFAVSRLHMRAGIAAVFVCVRWCECESAIERQWESLRCDVSVGTICDINNSLQQLFNFNILSL